MLQELQLLLLFLTCFVVPSSQWPYSLWSSKSQSQQSVRNVFRTGKFLPRVLNFFPEPVEEECISMDNRRRGICMNTYECRLQRGTFHGPCALGFGVCCIFFKKMHSPFQQHLEWILATLPITEIQAFSANTPWKKHEFTSVEVFNKSTADKGIGRITQRGYKGRKQHVQG
ncbi:PREDICTED: uncharacterized protein LOC105363935 [Ceratosolen solmsi marchali]|uniref:Uncharacterized protein LOC105363935 n=1 Tax=Ceratosolen solmsi marchali TaxID=326594 RepID=A0AAJ7DXI6_9HYME|nr:PREDICTED: uncharacterized protein LOC105363935 [Ceratosolen solmsi marchali]